MRHFLTLLVAIGCFANQGFAASKQDSLWQVYTAKNTPDSTKATALAKLGFIYMNTNLDSMLWAGKTGLALSLKHNFETGKAKNTMTKDLRSGIARI